MDWRHAHRPLPSFDGAGEVAKQLVWRSPQRGDQLQQRRQPDLTDAALNARDLNRRQSRLMRELFLRPSQLFAGGAEILPELLNGISHAVDRRWAEPNRLEPKR